MAKRNRKKTIRKILKVGKKMAFRFENLKIWKMAIEYGEKTQRVLAISHKLFAIFRFTKNRRGGRAG